MSVKRIYTARMRSTISEDFRRRNEEFAASLLEAVRSGRFSATFESIWSYRARILMEEMNNQCDIPPDDDVFIYNLVDGIFRPAVVEGYTPDPKSIIAMAKPLEDAAEALEKAAATSAADGKAGTMHNRPATDNVERQNPDIRKSMQKQVSTVRERPSKGSEEKQMGLERAPQAERQREEQAATMREGHLAHDIQEQVGGRNQEHKQPANRALFRKQKPVQAHASKSTSNVKTPQTVNRRTSHDAYEAELQSLLARKEELEKILTTKILALDNNEMADIPKSPGSTVVTSAPKTQQSGDPVTKRKRVDDSEVEDANEDKATNSITAPARKTQRSALLMASRIDNQTTPSGLTESRATLPTLSTFNGHHPFIMQQRLPDDLGKEDGESGDESEDYPVRKLPPRKRTGKIKGYMEVPSEEEGMDVDKDVDAVDTTASDGTRGDFSARNDRGMPPSDFPMNTHKEPNIHRTSGAPGTASVTSGVKFSASPTDVPEASSAAKKQAARECPMPEAPKVGDVLPIWVLALFPCDRCKSTKARCHVNIAVSPGSKTSRACGFCSSGKHRCSHTALSINMVSLLDAVAANTFIENTAYEIIALKQDVAALLDMKAQLSTVVKHMPTSSDLVNLREEVHTMHESVRQSIHAVREMGDELGQLIRKQRTSTLTAKTPARTHSLTLSGMAKFPLPHGPNALTQRQPMSQAGVGLASPLTMPAPDEMAQLHSSQDLGRVSPSTVSSGYYNGSRVLPSIPEFHSGEEIYPTDAIGAHTKPASSISFDEQSQSPSVMVNLHGINVDITTGLPDSEAQPPYPRTTGHHPSRPSDVVPVASSDTFQGQALSSRAFLSSKPVNAAYPVRRERTTSPAVTPMTQLVDISVFPQSHKLPPGSGDYRSLSSGLSLRRASSVPSQPVPAGVSISPTFSFVRKTSNVAIDKAMEKAASESSHVHTPFENDNICMLPADNHGVAISQAPAPQRQSDTAQDTTSRSHSSQYHTFNSPTVSELERNNICGALSHDMVYAGAPELPQEPFTIIQSYHTQAGTLSFESEMHEHSPQHRPVLNYDVSILMRDPVERDMDRIMEDDLSSPSAVVPPTEPIGNTSSGERSLFNTDQIDCGGDLSNPPVSESNPYSAADGDDDSDLTPFDEDDDEVEERQNTPPVEHPKMQTPRRNARRAASTASKLAAQVAGRGSVARTKK